MANKLTNNSHNSLKIKILIIAVTILSCACFLFLNYRTSILDSNVKTYNVGYFWTEPTLTADYNFSIYKPNIQYRADVQNAIDNVSPIFIFDSYAETNLIERIKSIVDDLLSHKDSTLKLYTTNSKIIAFYNQGEIVQAREIAKMTNQLIPFVKKIYKAGYINQSLDKFNVNDVFTIRLLPNMQYYTEKNVIFDKQKYSIKLQQFCSDVFNSETSSFITEIIFNVSQPNLVFSEELTSREIKNAEKSVRKTIGIVHKGEVIVARGDRLTEESILKIKSYNTANIAKEGNNVFSTLNILGSIGHSMMHYSILLLFLIIIRKKIWADNFHLLLLSLPLIFVAFMGWLTFQIQVMIPNIPIEYLIIVPAFSMFVAIVFDSRTAFYATVSMSLILAGVKGNDYFLGLTMLFTGTIAAYAVRDIQDRRQMFASIIFIFIGFVMSIFIIGLERGFDFSIVMPQLFLALINAITAPVITFALLLLINRYSKTITTNLKLREYIENEHPILLELRKKAPGTFEHSREVAQLAELAANSIGANSILTRVGAMFHDIGKMATPEYFTENKEQYIDIAAHTELSPMQSAKIIKDHIINGVKKAQELNLPQNVIDFIPQHHGTTLVRHFYNVALNTAKETGTEISQEDFRYPGPIPQSKEATILMLCDSAEAISKSVMDMKQFVSIFETTLEERIQDGQFDESEISLREIKKIKEVIFNEIKGKIHTRTQYAAITEEQATA
jgi:putative nucleotidyltransferase with HDIG domain